MAPTTDDVGATLSSSTDADGGASRSKASRDVARGPVELPLHLTEKILCCISPLESARLATVCKSWAATVAERLARPIPHLFVYLPADNKSDRRGLVVSVPIGDDGDAGVGGPAVIPNRVLLADTNGLACIGAMPSGLLAFASWWSKLLVLVNPITGARQSVQVEEPEPRRNLVLAAGVGGDSFISVGTDKHVLWRRAAGGGEEWSRWTVQAAAAHGTVNIVSAAVCRGCFYVLDDHGYVSVIDVAAPPPLRMEKLPVASLFDGGDHGVASRAVLNPAAQGHLIASDGEVLYVRPVLPFKDHEVVGAGGGTTFCDCGHDAAVFLAIAGFEVYRLDLEDRRRWAEVKKLPDDRAIFVSPGSSFVVRSSETPGCRSNCIYFVGNRWYCPLCNRDAGKAWGVYSMEHREVLFEHAVTEPGPCSAATWFLPSVV